VIGFDPAMSAAGRLSPHVQVLPMPIRLAVSLLRLAAAIGSD
jgi:hypothetical protein